MGLKKSLSERFQQSIFKCASAYMRQMLHVGNKKPKQNQRSAEASSFLKNFKKQKKSETRFLGDVEHMRRLSSYSREISRRVFIIAKEETSVLH